MLHTARAIHSEGPKELGGSRIRTADLKWPKGYSLPYDIKQNEFLRGWKFIFLLLLEGLAGHLAGGGNCLCSASYTRSYICVCSHNCYPFPFLYLSKQCYLNPWVLLSFSDSLLHPSGKEAVCEWLCGAQPPAGLKHSRQIGAQAGARRVEITADLTGSC